MVVCWGSGAAGRVGSGVGVMGKGEGVGLAGIAVALSESGLAVDLYGLTVCVRVGSACPLPVGFSGCQFRVGRMAGGQKDQQRSE